MVCFPDLVQGLNTYKRELALQYNGGPVLFIKGIVHTEADISAESTAQVGTIRYEYCIDYIFAAGVNPPTPPFPKGET